VNIRRSALLASTLSGVFYFVFLSLHIFYTSKVEDRLTFKALHRMALSRAHTPAKEQWKSIFADEKRVDPVKND